jgi:hypothetical protein
MQDLEELLRLEHLCCHALAEMGVLGARITVVGKEEGGQ